MGGLPDRFGGGMKFSSLVPVSRVEMSQIFGQDSFENGPSKLQHSDSKKYMKHRRLLVFPRHGETATVNVSSYLKYKTTVVKEFDDTRGGTIEVCSSPLLFFSLSQITPTHTYRYKYI